MKKVKEIWGSLPKGAKYGLYAVLAIAVVSTLYQLAGG